MKYGGSGMLEQLFSVIRCEETVPKQLRKVIGRIQVPTECCR